MAVCDLFSPQLLSQLLSYDPETGLFTWKARPEWLFLCSPNTSAASRAEKWNERNAGKLALNTLTGRGYFEGLVVVLGTSKKVYAHRVGLAIHYGAWPVGVVDHIDGDPKNNRLSNLRDVTQSMNSRNAVRSRNTPSGKVGVRWHKQSSRWLAYIGSGKERLQLGTFKELDAAISARITAETAMGFTGRKPRA